MDGGFGLGDGKLDGRDLALLDRDLANPAHLLQGHVVNISDVHGETLLNIRWSN